MIDKQTTVTVAAVYAGTVVVTVNGSDAPSILPRWLLPQAVEPLVGDEMAITVGILGVYDARPPIVRADEEAVAA